MEISQWDKFIYFPFFFIFQPCHAAILGLTILALGNCVADWVADTVVARAGKPEMAFASCFGSPLLSHVLGLSIAMIVRYSLQIKVSFMLSFNFLYT